VTFEEQHGKTLLVMHDLYSSKEALDAAGTARRMRWSRRSRNWTIFLTWARVWDGHEVVDLAVSAHKEDRRTHRQDGP
jgi:hypothetical protein